MGNSRGRTGDDRARDPLTTTDAGRSIGDLASGFVADLRRRWAAGEPAPVEGYLERHADVLRGDASAALDLIFAEYLARVDRGESPARDDYFRRFPAFVPALRLQFDLEDALRLGGPKWLSSKPGEFDNPTGPTDLDLPTGLRDLVGRSAVVASGRGNSTGSPRFRVVRKHAQGGLGVVSVAIDSQLNREVALKEILDQHADDPASRGRFLLEAEITGGLEHPGIVPVYDLGCLEGGRPYYAMRFIRGETLQEAIRRFHEEHDPEADPGRRTLAFRQLLRQFLDVCHAVGYAHSRGILHRDIKPSNVIVGRHGETLLVDWGLAKAMGRAESQEESSERALVPSLSGVLAQTQHGSALGTPTYMSPEQAAGDLEAVGPRSDLYSLGASLYVLLTGRVPFEGNIFEVLGRVQEGEFARPRSLAPTIDPALEAICLKAMATDPAGRYASARDLIEDVERWMSDEPVSAYPEPILRRAHRWARRHRTLVSTAAAALVAVVLGLSALAYQQARSNAALARANDKTSNALARSEESRRRAEAVEGFMVEAFQAASPYEDGRKLKVVDVLARAVGQLDRDTSIPGPTKGMLLQALGSTYRGMGLWPEAERSYRQARLLFEASFGPVHRESLLSAAREAVVAYESGRAVEALPRIEEALRALRRELGRHDPDVLEIQFHLGSRLSQSGRAEAAIELLREVLEQKLARLGPEHKETLISEDSLAGALATAGRFDEAIDRLEKIAPIMEKRLGLGSHPSLVSRIQLAQTCINAGRPERALACLDRALQDSLESKGPDDLTTIEIRNSQAMALHAVGRDAEAVPIQQEVRRARGRALGPDHPLTIVASNNLAAGYLSLGRTDEAIAMFAQALRGFEATLGPEHAHSISARNGLAVAYKTAGKLDEAIPIFRANLEVTEAAVGPDQPLTITSRDNLAVTCEQLGMCTEAEGLFRRNLEILRRMEKADSPLLASALGNLGRNLLLQARHLEAEPLLRESLMIREKVIPDNWRRFSVMSILGAALAGQARYDEAEPLILSGYEGLKAREGTISSVFRRFLDDAADRVVRFYQSRGRLEEARSWAEKLGRSELPADVFARP